MLYWIMYAIAYIPMLLIFPTKVYGRKNLVKGKAILISNHTSNNDPAVLMIKTHRRIRFLGKKELVNTRFKKWFMTKQLSMIPIDRGGSDVAAVKNVFGVLKKGKYVGVFPQGTRKDENDLVEAKSGACMFAIKTKTQVVPVYLYHKPRAFRRNVLLIGKPFELSEYYDKRLSSEVLAEAGEVLSNKLNELKSDYERYLNEKKIVKELKKSHK